MSWTLWLVMGLVLCMLLGPILFLKPSPRQQRLAQLRARAPKLGLKIHMTQLGGEERAVYQLPWPAGKERYAGPDWCLERKAYIHDIHICQYWYWVESSAPESAVIHVLTAQLPHLPDSINGVAADRKGLSCYWNERGGEATQDVIAQWLEQTQAMFWPVVAKRVEPDGPPESVDQESEDEW